MRKGCKSLKKWADTKRGLGAQKMGRCEKGARGAKKEQMRKGGKNLKKWADAIRGLGVQKRSKCEKGARASKN